MDKSQKGKFTLLVVDDDPINLKIMENLLTKHGYNIVKASSGSELFEKLNSDTVDLILLDVVLPDINGYEICRKLKAEDDLKHIPVLFLTIKDDSRDIVKGFEAGGEDYILKPYNPLEVIARLDNQLKILESQRIIEKYNHDLEEILQKRTEQLILSERRSAIGLMIQGVINNLQIPVEGMKNRIRMSSEVMTQLEGLCVGKKDFVFKMIGKHIQELHELNYDSTKIYEQLNRIIHSLKSKILLTSKKDSSVSEINSIINEEILFMQLHYDFSNRFEKELELSKHEIFVSVNQQDSSQIFQSLLMIQMALLEEEEKPVLIIKSGVDNNMGWFKIEAHGILKHEALKSYLCFKDLDADQRIVNDTTMLYCCRTISTYKGRLDITQQNSKKVVTKVEFPLLDVK